MVEEQEALAQMAEEFEQQQQQNEQDFLQTQENLNKIIDNQQENEGDVVKAVAS